jgi:hypothetical protein
MRNENAKRYPIILISLRARLGARPQTDRLIQEEEIRHERLPPAQFTDEAFPDASECSLKRIPGGKVVRSSISGSLRVNKIATMKSNRF